MKKSQKKKIKNKHIYITTKYNMVEIEDILDCLSYSIREINWKDHEMDDLSRLNELKFLCTYSNGCCSK